MAKVMIVDDDRTTVSLLKTLLELDGFEVAVVTRGNDVLAQVEAHQPAAIVMDYHLNDVEGVVILRQLRALPTYAALPIIIASGMNVEDEVMQAGATHFMLKPFDPSGLSDWLLKVTA